MTEPARPPNGPLLIVGAGCVGLSLAAAAARAGLPAEIIGRGNRRRAVTVRGRRLAVHAAKIRSTFHRPVRLVLAVPDDDLLAAATDCAATASRMRRHRAAHVRRPYGRDAGAAAAAWLAGALLAPSATFPEPDPARFTSIVVCVEGDPAAVRAGKHLARRLGARPVDIPLPERALPLPGNDQLRPCGRPNALLPRLAAGLPAAARKPLARGFSAPCRRRR